MPLKSPISTFSLNQELSRTHMLVYMPTKWCCVVAFSKTSTMSILTCFSEEMPQLMSCKYRSSNLSRVSLLRMLRIRRSTSSSESFATSPCSLRFRCCATQESCVTTRFAGTAAAFDELVASPLPWACCLFSFSLSFCCCLRSCVLAASRRQPPLPPSSLSLGYPPLSPPPPLFRPKALLPFLPDFSELEFSLLGFGLLAVADVGGRSAKPVNPPLPPGRKDRPRPAVKLPPAEPPGLKETAALGAAAAAVALPLGCEEVAGAGVDSGSS
mmetsp:Transcript_26463/g.61700  ORF Transcript_26463/g.61700 Transcript_26463/m.61700 type:complete len:270 (+) Transcript_26463:616-1425(+)